MVASRYTVAVLLLFLFEESHAQNTTSPPQDCRCGFIEPSTGMNYSDSIIVYFNETQAVPEDIFAIDSFEHAYEIGYSITDREGASSSNVYFEEGETWNMSPKWLNLNVSGNTAQHLVNGAQLRTLRRDIQYGSFRIFMRSPAPWAGGSGLTMRLQHNESRSAEIDLLNMDDSTNNAAVQTTVGNQAPDIANGINYTVLEEPQYHLGPWDFLEYRMDWSEQSIEWYVGPNKTRTIEASEAQLDDVPVAVFLKHWSNGDKNWMQGPPTNDTKASVGWVRWFFNSSVQNNSANSDCNESDRCSTVDMSLRVSSAFSDDSTKLLQATSTPGPTPNSVGIAVCIASVCFSAALALHAVVHRALSREDGGSHDHRKCSTTCPSSSQPSTGDLSKHESSENASQETIPEHQRQGIGTAGIEPVSSNAAIQVDMDKTGAVAAANPGARPPPLSPPRQRIDYLAGLVALASLIVSCTHFVLTFVPAAIEEYIPAHYNSEYWARRTFYPLLHDVWLGVFFTTSTRFLVAKFLKTGDIKEIAEKVVSRCPRLMIPIGAVILFEYFIIDVGGTKYLEYLPSITWTDWVGVSVFPNFGWFIDETLHLFYLIPNAAPQITSHYATGVLWTVPVQLQNSWVVLLGVVVIAEIKSPWKRMLYYAFCIVNHWYAMSWGSYFWAGLLLADLDLSYKWRKHITARLWIHYPLLLAALALAVLSLSNNLISIHTGFSFSTSERGIHPDAETALPIAQTSRAGYQQYYKPTLNGLVFAVAAQYVVELSTWAQAFLSTKPFLLLFPHIFTIYLIHGLVFWSIGSVVCVYFATQRLEYWLNILLTAIICYATLFACLPVVTPVIEKLGKEITKGIWKAASTESATSKPMIYPFSRRDVERAMGLEYTR